MEAAETAAKPAPSAQKEPRNGTVIVVALMLIVLSKMVAVQTFVF
jgi:hypothetical protein